MSSAFEEAMGCTGKGAREKLIEISLRSDLFHDERGDAYAAIIELGVRRVLRVRSRSYRSWLAGTYHAETQKGANGEALTAALTVAEARACAVGSPQHRLDVRFAHRGDNVFIDLADAEWRVIRVNASGWQVLSSTEAPILFRRFSHQAALPRPENGGDVRQLLDFLHVENESDQLLILTWLVSVALAEIPRPILVLYGPQGSAKTIAARLLRSVIDPSEIETVDVGRDSGELALALDHHAVPLFDNVSHVSKWQANRLCCAVTGAGFSKRMLYTDADDVLLRFKRAILMTGINVPTIAPDLLDRMLLLQLSRIPPAARREEAVLLSKFDAARPVILGGLLDALVGAMRIRPGIQLTRLPRMADFFRWGAAVAEALGYGSRAFVAAYMKNVSVAVNEALESDPLALAVVALARESGKWSGTFKHLHQVLSERHPAQAGTPEWPKDATRLSRRLRILHSTLAEVGVTVTFLEKKTSEGLRAVELRFLDPEAPEPPNGPEGRDVDFGSYSGATETSDPGTAPSSFDSGNGFPGDSGATGATSPPSTVCPFHIGAIPSPCGRCGCSYLEHIQ